MINLPTTALPKLFDCDNVNPQQTFVCNALCTKSLTLNFMKGHFLAYELFLKTNPFKRKVPEEGHNGYHCVPHEIFSAMVLIPFHDEKMVVFKKIFKFKNGLTFPLLLQNCSFILF